MQGWKEQPEEASPWARAMLDNQEQEGELQEEDEEELERAEAFEHRYNFRFEVGPSAWTRQYLTGLCVRCQSLP